MTSTVRPKGLQSVAPGHTSPGLVADQADHGSSVGAPDEGFLTMASAVSNYEIKELPWWRRPSPWWVLAAVPISSIAYSATIASRIEIYTYVACRAYRPGIVMLDEQTPSITTTVGILTCLTAGFWGSFSDRHGRTFVMGLSLLAALTADATYIAMVRFYDIFPGGSWFLLVSAIVEGLLGGTAAAEASAWSYMADVTDESSRSRFFSSTMGLSLVGIAVGPMLGSLFISNTHNALSAFYFCAVLHLLLIVFVFFMVPESASKEKRQRSKEIYRRDLHNASLEQDQTVPVALTAKLQRVLPFLRPLTVFIPYREDSGTARKTKRDWSLTLVAFGYGSTVTTMGAYPYKLNYAASTFHWDSVDLGYFIGLVGLASAIFLILVFPIITKHLRPRPIIVEIQDPSSNVPKTITKAVHSSDFDLRLVKASLILNVVIFSFNGITKSPLIFTTLSMIGSFGMAFNPAVQSVALALYTQQGGVEVGRLFGGMSVVQAIFGQLLGPIFYGAIYARTVSSYPSTFLFVCAASLALAFMLIATIRIPQHGGQSRNVGGDLEESVPLLGNDSGSAEQTVSPSYGV